jgi:hypothetical protein
MRDLSELNINEGGRPVPRSAPTLSALQRFEAEFGFPLPLEIQTLLSAYNGGHPELDCIDTINGDFAIDHFYHLTDDDESTESLWYAMRTLRRILGNEAVPFAADGGDNQFFLDLSRTPYPVRICLYEPGFKSLLLANNFTEFISLLAVDPDSI